MRDECVYYAYVEAITQQHYPRVDNMAYVDADRKKKIAPGVKQVLKANGLRGTLSVKDRMVLVLTIQSGWLDFIGNFNDTCQQSLAPDDRFTPAVDYIQVNEYFIDRSFSGEAARVLNELKAAMSVGNWNKSDIMTDYFNVGWYININIGKYDKPYMVK